MSGHEPFPRSRVSLFRVLFFAIVVGPPNLQPARAQTAPADLEAKAKKIAETGERFEAAQLYREALKTRQKCLAEHADNAETVLAWGNCRNRLAEQLIALHLLAEAKTVLTETRDRLQAYLERHPDDTSARAELARTWERLALRATELGNTEEATCHLRQAIDLHRKLAAEPAATPERRAELARLLTVYAGDLMALARYQDAASAYEEGLAVGRKLLADCPDQTIAVEGLANTLNCYALLVRETGQFSSAADMIREAIRLLSKLETQYPDAPEHWYALPTFYRNLSQPLAYLTNANEMAMARREAERLDARLARFPDASKKWLTDENKIFSAAANADMSRFAGLQGELENNLKTMEANVRLHPEIPVYRLKLSAAKLTLGIGLAAAGKPDQDAARMLREALEPCEKLVADYPDVPKYRGFLAVIRMTVGSGDIVISHGADGRKQLERGVALYRQLADENPGEPEWRKKLIDITPTVFQTCLTQSDWVDAEWILSVTREELKKLTKAYPSCPRYRRSEAIACTMVATLRQAQGAPDAAEAALREAVVLWRKMVVDFPDNPEMRTTLADALSNLGMVVIQQGKYAEAAAVVEEMLKLHEALAREFPKDPEYVAKLAVDHGCYGDTLERQGKLEAGLEQRSRAIESFETAMRLNPRRRDWLGALRLAHLRRADDYLKLGKTAEYEAALAGVKPLEEYLEAPLMRLSRINDRLAHCQRAAALKEADDLLSNCDLTAAQLDDLAAFYATAAGSGPATEQETCAARAVDALRRACELGRMSFVALDADPRYRGVANRADFKKLVAEQRK
jgi:tetratricopeptide (TPR) repeat protein